MIRNYYIALFFLIIIFLNCTPRKVSGLPVSNLTYIDSLFLVSAKSELTIDKRKELLSLIQKEISVTKDHDSIKRNQRLQLANGYYAIKDFTGFLSTSRFVLKNADLQKDNFGLTYAAYNIALLKYAESDYDSAYYFYSKAERAAQHQTNNPLYGRIILNKADILYFKMDFVEAEIQAIEALKFGKRMNDSRLQYDAFVTLGNSISGLNDNEKALQYFQKAYSITTQLKGDDQYILLKAQACNYIAKVYQKMGHHNTAIKYLEKALSFGNINKSDTRLYSYLINNLAFSEFKTRSEKALPLFLEALAISDSLANIPTQISVKINLATYYLSKKNKKKAFIYLNDARIKAHENNIFEDELKTLLLISKIDLLNSSIYLKRYINLNDSLQNIERSHRNKFARIEYETDEILYQKNVAIAEKKALSAQRWLIVGISFMSILLLLALFYIKIAKAKNKELLMIKAKQQDSEEIYRLMLNQQQKVEEGKQMEKSRMSKELHDGIMGRLSSIRLNLFILNKKTDPETIRKCLLQIDDIQNIEKEIRTIAHDLNKNIFSGSSDFILVLQDLCFGITNHSEIRVSLEIDDQIDWLQIDSNLKMQIYRILQESLQNIHKHANASSISIFMFKTSKSIEIKIVDDGTGFDLKTHKNGIGINNMKERIKEVGGNIQIESAPQYGTKINLIIPI